MSDTSRLDMLRQLLVENPADSFARYGVAMEYRRLGRTDDALAEFAALIQGNPDYTAAYFMAAQTLAEAGRTGQAKQMLSDGIASAARTNNQHARSEMEAMLDDLDRD